MAKEPKAGGNKTRKITRYVHDDVKEPRTPETGHTSLLPADEQAVTLPMDNGWTKAIDIFEWKKRTTDYYRADSGYVAAWYLDGPGNTVRETVPHRHAH